MHDHQLPAEWRLEARLPTANEHRRLAEAVGWAHAFEWTSVPASLAASLYGVVAVVGDEVIGMGRLVGDGVMYFYIQDVAVHPHFQRRDIGQAIVTALMEHVQTVAPASAFVGLFATPEAIPLYHQTGFAERDLTGMSRLVESGD